MSFVRPRPISISQRPTGKFAHPSSPLRQFALFQRLERDHTSLRYREPKRVFASCWPHTISGILHELSAMPPHSTDVRVW